MGLSVGFVDPQVFSVVMVGSQPAVIIKTLKNVMHHDFVVAPYNTGGHWVLVIISMKWGWVWI